MNLLEEVLRVRERKTRLGGPEKAILKLFVLTLSLVGIFAPRNVLYSLLIASISSCLLIIGEALGVLLSGLAIFSLTIAPIDLLSLLYGGEPSKILSVTFYTLSTMLSLLLFVSTTTNSDFERVFGRRKLLTYTYSSLFYFMNSFKEIEDSFRVRGYEYGLGKPWSYAPLLIAYVFNIMEKLNGVDESLEARGGD